MAAPVEEGQVKVGIIGCGHVARTHIASLQQLRGVEIVGVCDADEQRAEMTAREYGIRRGYRQASALLAELRPDVVHVLTPPRTHREVAIQAMDAGCHVLVEKPMALNPADADEMVAVSQRRSRSLSVCHNLLFDPAILEARELIAQGAIGTVVGADAFWGYVHEWLGRFKPGHWVYDLPGGFFHESAPHPVYLEREFLRGVKVICASASKAGNVLPIPRDGLSVLFDGEAGPGSVTFSLPAAPYRRWLTVFGSDATIRVDLAHSRLELYRAGTPDSLRRACGEGLHLVSGALHRAIQRRMNRRRGAPSTHQRFIESYYASLWDGRDPAVTAEDGLAVVAVLEQIWDALTPAPAGQPVVP